jgi:hypothetical protein
VGDKIRLYNAFMHRSTDPHISPTSRRAFLSLNDDTGDLMARSTAVVASSCTLGGYTSPPCVPRYFIKNLIFNMIEDIFKEGVVWCVVRCVYDNECFVDQFLSSNI